MNQKIKFLLFVFSLAVLGLQAQNGRGFRMEPEALAQRQTDDMAEQLALSEAQKEKVHQVNLNFAQKMKAAREEADGDWTAMRETIGALRKEKNAELKKYLTGEQFKKWEDIQAERREKRGNRGNRGERNKAQDGSK